MIQEDAMSYFKLGGDGNPDSEHLASVFSVFGQTHCLPFASNLYARLSTLWLQLFNTWNIYRSYNPQK